ncbi:MAG: hypothetical protein WCV81_05990, partial [Microgenomates group bacterium]
MNLKIKALLIFSFFSLMLFVYPKQAQACVYGPDDMGCGDPEGVCWTVDAGGNWHGDRTSCGQPPPPPDSPVVTGHLRDFFYQPIVGKEVRWTDKLGNVRKYWTDANGYFSFSSWLNISGAQRTAEYGSFPNAPWTSNTYQYEAFSAAQNAHTFTGIKPGNWYGAMVVRSGILLAATPDPTIIDLWYKNTPTASINGPTSGYVGTAYNFAATGTGPGIGRVQVYWARQGDTLSSPTAWTMVNQVTQCAEGQWQNCCDGSSTCTLYTASFTPPSVGSYYITVNSYADFHTPSTVCSGNPWIDTGQITGVASCNWGSATDWILFTATNAPVDG